MLAIDQEIAVWKQRGQDIDQQGIDLAQQLADLRAGQGDLFLVSKEKADRSAHNIAIGEINLLSLGDKKDKVQQQIADLQAQRSRWGTIRFCLRQVRARLLADWTRSTAPAGVIVGHAIAAGRFSTVRFCLALRAGNRLRNRVLYLRI